MRALPPWREGHPLLRKRHSKCPARCSGVSSDAQSSGTSVLRTCRISDVRDFHAVSFKNVNYSFDTKFTPMVPRCSVSWRISSSCLIWFFVPLYYRPARKNDTRALIQDLNAWMPFSRWCARFNRATSFFWFVRADVHRELDFRWAFLRGINS